MRRSLTYANMTLFLTPFGLQSGHMPTSFLVQCQRINSTDTSLLRTGTSP